MEESIDFVIHSGRPDAAVELRDYATRRLSFCLRRFGHRVRHVTVRLIDQNGPRRGIDSRCSMSVDLVDGRRIFVDVTTAWPFTSITRAVGRLNERMRREFGRENFHRGTVA